MRDYSHLRDYQLESIEFIMRSPQCMLWLDMGLGKTISTLTAINNMQHLGLCRAALVFAPLRVAQTVWPAEARDWAHLRGLRVSSMLGNPQQRLNGLMTPAHFYVINYDNMQWLADTVERLFIKQHKLPPFDVVVFDEVDKMKDSANKRSRAWRKIAPYVPRRIGLTGTPSNEGLMDLHGQFRAIDDGVRLGTSKTEYQNNYFYTERFDLIPFDDSAAIILGKIQDIVYSRQRSSSERKMIFNDVAIPLDDALLRQYRAFKRDSVLDASVEITAANAAVLAGKLKQWCGGAVYDNDGNAVHIHDAKLEALDSIVAEVKTPILVTYNYVHELERIKARYPFARGVEDFRDAVALEDAWNSNRIRLLCAHPASLGHGMNLQKGDGHTLVWYSLPDASRLYEQMNARLDRSGQAADIVMCHRLITSTHIERGVADALASKEHFQTALRAAVEREREEIKQ